jgi:hypothetical protein
VTSQQKEGETMRETSPRVHDRQRLLFAAPMLAAAMLFSAGQAAGQAAFASRDATVPDEVTFSEHVAPLVQQNCAFCHRDGGIGPMVLETYQQVKRWAGPIADKVARREMPPYQYDSNVGIQDLEGDLRMSDEEIATFVQWVAQGAPEGDPALLPPPLELPDPAEWRLAEKFGQPDLIVPSKPYTVPAEGQDLWWEPLVPIPTDRPRYLKAIEVKPSVAGRMVAHHANTSMFLMGDNGRLERQAGTRFTEYASGKLGEIIPEGAGRLLPPNAFVRWSIHYYPHGEVLENDVVELGFWFHPEGYVPEYTQNLNNYRLEGDLLIPPHGTTMTQGFHSWDHPVRIDSYQPHAHLRLRAASMEVYDPATGRREVVSAISNWSAWWQHSHLYAPDAAPLIPAGAIMILTHWYDNTADNPSNPDPDQWVYGGARTGDEMSHDWIAVSHLSQEQYEEIKAQREQKPRAVAQAN